MANIFRVSSSYYYYFIDCESGWLYYDTRCYKVLGDMTFDAGFAACANLGARVLEWEDDSWFSRTRAAIIAQISEYHDNYWTSARRNKLAYKWGNGNGMYFISASLTLTKPQYTLLVSESKWRSIIRKNL